MGKIAFVFAGQGSQAPGMGRELCEFSPAAAELFRLADGLRPGTSKRCFEGSKEELAVTVNTQPCLFAVDLAAANALQESGIRPECVAGFSLGEVAALTFAGIFSDEEGFRAVCRRAELMQKAVEENPGGMLAVLGLQGEEVETLCQEIKNIFPVNYNCPGQTVAAGTLEAVELLYEAVRKQGGKAIRLVVGGAFHTPFMLQASNMLYEYLCDVPLQEHRFPVYANATAQPYGENVRALLALQVKSPVLWQKTIENMAEAGVDTFVEVGPGKTLCNLIKKILPEAAVCNVENVETLKAALEMLKKR